VTLSIVDMKKTILIPTIGIAVVALVIGLWSYTRANDGATISICVKKSGLVYIIGGSFRREDCKKNESLLTWNIQGIQGPKGDKGDKGDLGSPSWDETRFASLEVRVEALESLIIPTPTPTLIPIAKCSASTTCGSSCSYGGVAYNTVLIGTQCWFKENLNVGTMIANLETPDDIAPSLNDPNTVQKWCYDNSSTYCTNEGGLYTWSEANALADSCNSTFCGVSTPSQGICPTGWHIPTDAEQYTLENYLTTPGQTCDATRNGNDCSDAGTKLIFGGSSGFDAIGAGNHETNGAGSFFDKREPSIHIWSSSEQPVIPSYAWHRTFIGGSGSPLVGRGSYIKAFGFSVRCLANTTNVE